MRAAGDGRPLAVHLAAIEAQTGVKPASLKAAEEPLPIAVAYLKGWYLELAAVRGGNGFGGLNRISYQDIDAWARLTGRHLVPAEVECLLMLDQLFLATLASKESSDG